jgi:uncharacterized protein
MKIGVISDTHLRGPDNRLREIVQTHFSVVDLILHAGDLECHSVLNVFGEKKVVAVHGNNDSSSVKRELPREAIVPIGRFRIGLIHGDGGFRDITDRIVDIEDRIRREFGNVDCIVYGHTHYPANRDRNGILFFNPGTAFARRWDVPNSVGILDVAYDGITGQIICLDEG